MVKFNKFNITNGKLKSRIHYSVDNHISGQPCVTLYAKDYTNDLHLIIDEGYENNTDMMTDYFEKGRACLFADHPLYAAARAKALSVTA